MTAEIGILNKAAVALAADSAVTIQQQKGQKIYNSANKLFMLSKYHPVGIMLFGDASFMGVPWETIIKEYRKILGTKEYPTIREYINNFTGFLDANTKLFPEAQQTAYLESDVSGYFLSIKQEIKKKLEEKVCNKETVDDAVAQQIVSEAIKSHFDKWAEFPLLKHISEDDYKAFIAKHKTRIEGIATTVFEKLSIIGADKEKLLEISAGLFYRSRFPQRISGIVIAGFGKDELFPSLVVLQLECIVENKLKYVELEKLSASVDFNNNAAIVPLAQSEMAHTFIEGVDPMLERFSVSYLERVFNNFPEAMLKALDLKDENQKKEFLKKLGDASKQICDDYKTRVGAYRQKNHIEPVINIVAVLPKDELASLAEALVNLTSLKRRVTMDAETVGGPIDVAVISKGDGFIWIKRKHYFKPELNPQFIKNYFRRGVIDEEDEGREEK